MKQYKYEIFDSKNTCIEQTAELYKDITASIKAEAMSRTGYGKVIVSSKNGFEEYEKGQLVSWSYPNGLGQIKANS